jgi:uncharacterized OsmC-like protein
MEGMADDATLFRSEVRVALTGEHVELVTLPGEDTPVPMGMRDEMASFYGHEPGTYERHAGTLDYLVGAVTACLAANFEAALNGRGVGPAPGELQVTATGDVEVERGVPLLKRIVVRYELAGSDPERRDRVDRAHDRHHRACAVSRSLEAAIDIRTELHVV